MLIARPLAAAGVSPTGVTLFGLLLALLSVLFLQVGGCPRWGALLALLASLTDFFDGPVARLQNRVSAWGNYLDAVVDKLVEVVLLLGLAPFFPLVVPFAVASGFLVSYCKPRVALVIETDNRDWPGPADHADRMTLIVVAYVLYGFGWVALAQGCLLLLTALGAVGTALRLSYARQLIDEAERSGGLRDSMRPSATSAQKP